MGLYYLIITKLVILQAPALWQNADEAKIFCSLYHFYEKFHLNIKILCYLDVFNQEKCAYFERMATCLKSTALPLIFTRLTLFLFFIAS